jgi:Cu(I)/Ag(I) efflux system membrane fusion protein
VIAEVFERQADWVKEGESAIATLPYLPGKIWQGKVDYVYPELDQKTHTLRVRVLFPNPDLRMKPNMYTDVKIFGRTMPAVLAIPRAGLIQTGKGDHVILALGDGRFMMRSVKVGIESGDYYEILSGLKGDERLVTSAQFLIDSESSMQAGFSRMNDDEDSLNDSVSNDTPQEFVGMGHVLAISRLDRTIAIKHEAIPALEMPAMTMKLSVDKSINLDNVKVGDALHFVLIKDSKGDYQVTKVHVMP